MRAPKVFSETGSLHFEAGDGLGCAELRRIGEEGWSLVKAWSVSDGEARVRNGTQLIFERYVSSSQGQRLFEAEVALKQTKVERNDFEARWKDELTKKRRLSDKYGLAIKALQEAGIPVPELPEDDFTPKDLTEPESPAIVEESKGDTDESNPDT